MCWKNAIHYYEEKSSWWNIAELRLLAKVLVYVYKTKLVVEFRFSRERLERTLGMRETSWIYGEAFVAALGVIWLFQHICRFGPVERFGITPSLGHRSRDPRLGFFNNLLISTPYTRNCIGISANSRKAGLKRAELFNLLWWSHRLICFCQASYGESNSGN